MKLRGIMGFQADFLSINSIAGAAIALARFLAFKSITQALLCL